MEEFWLSDEQWARLKLLLPNLQGPSSPTLTPRLGQRARDARPGLRG